jgi:2-methylcitrate dehydratase PrpD
MDAIEQFADYIAETKYSNLPHDVVDNTKKFIMDTIGVGIAGLKAPGCQQILETVQKWGGPPESTVLMSGHQCPAPWAAFVNSVFMHALDFDDALDASALHANVSVLPAALALAEARENTTGKDLICAVAIGQDIVCRMGASLKRPLAWIRTATCGYFGATAAAGNILKLDKEKLWNAFGIAYSQTAGNSQCLVDGALVKRMQPAFAAKAAVVSCMLAQNGITGARNVLEGDYGFFKLYEGNEYDRKVLLEGLGKSYKGMDLSVKPYPSCRMTHASIDAALQIRKDPLFHLSDIEKIKVSPSVMSSEMVGSPFQIRKNPQVDAQFSIPYTVAVALTKGDVFLEDFEEKNIFNKELKMLADKVVVSADVALDERDIMHCRIEALMKGGKTIQAEISALKGNPLNPMSTDDCMEKFRKCASYSSREIPADKVSNILNILSHLEDIKDIKQLTGLLA